MKSWLQALHYTAFGIALARPGPYVHESELDMLIDGLRRASLDDEPDDQAPGGEDFHNGTG